MRKIWLSAFVLALITMGQIMAQGQMGNPMANPMAQGQMGNPMAPMRPQMPRPGAGSPGGKKQPILYFGRVAFGASKSNVDRICNKICRAPRFKYSGKTRVMNMMRQKDGKVRRGIHRQCGCLLMPKQPKSTGVSAGFMGAQGHPEQYCPQICATRRMVWNGNFSATPPHFNDRKCMCIPAGSDTHLSPSELQQVRMLSLKVDHFKQMNMPLQLDNTEQALVKKIQSRQRGQAMLSAEEQLLLQKLDGAGMSGGMSNPFAGGGGETPPYSAPPMPGGNPFAGGVAMPQPGAGANTPMPSPSGFPPPSAGAMGNPFAGPPVRPQASVAPQGSGAAAGSTARIMMNNPEFRKFATEQGYNFN